MNTKLVSFNRNGSSPERYVVLRDDLNRDDFPPMAGQIDLPCCALSMLRAENKTNIDCIKEIISNLQKEAKQKWNTKIWGGQRAIFCISVHPHEMQLEKNLKTLGFKKIYEFNRRNGYPDGKCWMWIMNW